MTWHGQVNTSKTQVEMWLYVAGGNAGGRGQGAAGPATSQSPTPAQPAAPTAAVGAGRGGGRGAGNPNLSRDPAVVNQANVKGTPLK
jgi:hypothetical protein